MLDVSRRSAYGDLVVSTALAPRHVRVRPVIPDEMTPGLGYVHDHAGQKLGRVEGLGHIPGLAGAAVVTSLGLIDRASKSIRA